MIATTLRTGAVLSVLFLPCPAAVAELPPTNELATKFRTDGWSRAGVRVDFPAPRLAPGRSEADERAALLVLGGSERGVVELTRDSVTAPFVLKTSDLPTQGGVVRKADLWFVVHARLDEIEPETAASGGTGDQVVEAGNMRFELHRLTGSDLTQISGPTPHRQAGSSVGYVHVKGRLLDRLEVEATDRIVGTRSGTEWVVASVTDENFDRDARYPNRWRPVQRKGTTDDPGPYALYPGGASIVTIQQLVTVPGALLVEAHFAFFEPQAWFNGGPILRSKLGLVTQDRVRALRREIAKSRKPSGGRSSQATRPERIPGRRDSEGHRVGLLSEGMLPARVTTRQVSE